MNKKIGREKASPTDQDSIVDSSATDELEPEENLETPEAQMGADEEAEADIRDDTSLQNQLGEAQRLLSKYEERESKQYDDLAEITRSMIASQAEPQVNREDVELRRREELEELGLDPQVDGYMQRRIDAAVNARVQGLEARQTSGNQMSHDSLTRRAVDDIVGVEKHLKPFKKEIDDFLFRNATAAVRQQYSPEEAADMAAAHVSRVHRDDIHKAIRTAATKEARANRRVENETVSSGSQVITEGDAHGLHPLQAELARKKGWSMDQMREANKRYDENVTRGQKGMR